MSWATDIAKKKKTNTQGQALDRFSFDELFSKRGVSGQSGGASNVSPTDTGQGSDAQPTINYGSGIGLIPGTKAYADWKRQASSGGGNAPPGSDPPQAEPGDAQPGPNDGAPGNYTVTLPGGGTREYDRAKVDAVLASLPESQRAQLRGVLNGGNFSDIMGLLRGGMDPMTLFKLQSAGVGGTGVGGRGGSDLMRFKGGGGPRGNGGYGSYEPKWMAKRRERNAAQYAPEPAAPYVPNMPGYITEDKLPPGYTPINGTHDPQSGLPMVSQAVGPDGSMWGVGPDGMPMKLGPAYNDVPQYNPNSPTYQLPNGMGTGINLQPLPGQQQLPPEMMQMLLSQLPYFNMYMQGMTPY